MVRKNLKITIDREEEILGNLYDNFLGRDLHSQQHKSFTLLEIKGNITLAYYRGIALGRENGMNLMGELLLKNHPELKKEMKEIFKNNRINTN